MYVIHASVKTLPVSVAFHAREQLKWKETEVETVTESLLLTNIV